MTAALTQPREPAPPSEPVTRPCPPPAPPQGLGGAQPPPGTGTGSARRPCPRLPQSHQGKAAILPPRHMTPWPGSAFPGHFPPRPGKRLASELAAGDRGGAARGLAGTARPLQPGGREAPLQAFFGVSCKILHGGNTTARTVPGQGRRPLWTSTNCSEL